ncbi:MAG: Rpn family recombination-promoting nuclease/putative transposase [Bdellovibrionota bacterium]
MNNITPLETGKLFDAKVDYVFKRIFGHKDYNFIDFANKVLALKEENKIISVEFLNLEVQKSYEEDKESRFDVLAKLNDGSRISIEMQLGHDSQYEKRALYYWSKLYEDPLQENMRYKDLKKTVAIHILNFNLFHDKNYFHSKLVIADESSQQRRFHDFETHIIELKKLSKTCYDQPSPLEKWVLFIKDPSKENLEALAMQDSAIAKAIKDLEILSYDPKNRVLYEARRKYWLDFNSQICDAKDEGMAKGIEEGEFRKSSEMARKMKAKQKPTDEIMEFTGLTREQIEKA